MTGGCKTMTAFSALFFFFAQPHENEEGFWSSLIHSQDTSANSQQPSNSPLSGGGGLRVEGGRERQSWTRRVFCLMWNDILTRPVSHSAVNLWSWSTEAGKTMSGGSWESSPHTNFTGDSHTWHDPVTHTGNLHYTHLSKGDFFFMFANKKNK